MIYVDTNVVMYAVGRPHPLQEGIRNRLLEVSPGTLATSAEVLQELLHAYLPVGRRIALDAAFRLVGERMVVWPVDQADVDHARALSETVPSLDARDLIHLAIHQRRRTDELWTYDRGLLAATA